MAMKLIKKTVEYKIFLRGDDRYAIQDANGKPVNGEEKVRILVEEDLIQVTLPSPKEEAPEAGDAAEEAEGEAEASDDAGEPEPEPEEAPEEAAPEAEPEAEAEEPKEESEKKDK